MTPISLLLIDCNFRSDICHIALYILTRLCYRMSIL